MEHCSQKKNHNLRKLVDDANKANLDSAIILSIQLDYLLNWFENRPLFGKICITRPEGQIVIKENVKIEGLKYWNYSYKIIPQEDQKLITETFGIATYEWVVFTSANGAREF